MGRSIVHTLASPSTTSFSTERRRLGATQMPNQSGAKVLASRSPDLFVKKSEPLQGVVRFRMVRRRPAGRLTRPTWAAVGGVAWGNGA